MLVAVKNHFCLCVSNQHLATFKFANCNVGYRKNDA